MKKYSKEELAEILRKHKLWLQEDPEGECADLRCADLSRAQLSGAQLNYARLNGADLSRAQLSGAHLNGADLSRAQLSGAQLSGAQLNYADLSRAQLSRAQLSGAQLSGAQLNYARLNGLAYNADTAGYALACPEKGAYIAYKKASGYIVELEIPADAQRSSATTRKCRASKAKVLSITTCEGNEGPKAVYSAYDPSFVYQVGETVEVTYFDPDRWHECSTGIHHFITRDEAVKY